MTERFGMFDSVKLKEGVATEDMYGELVRLPRGKRGSVLQPGKKPSSYIVEFQTGRSMHSSDFTQVDLPVDLLEVEASIGTPFAESDWGKPHYWFDV